MRPRSGEIVTVEITPGRVVRSPHSARRIESGDRVTWSTFYERRRREGALQVTEPGPDVPSPESDTDTAGG